MKVLTGVLSGQGQNGVSAFVPRKRGCLRKGKVGELDLEKAARILLTEYRNGTLGRTILETPDSREALD